jgi:hypothetical protein
VMAGSAISAPSTASVFLNFFNPLLTATLR